MFVQGDVEEPILRLIGSGRARIDCGGSALEAQFNRERQEVSLTVRVFFGGNYIPKSVRGTLSDRPDFVIGSLPTTFSIDEEQFSVYLHYRGLVQAPVVELFKQVLGEFCFLASKWKRLLNDAGERDLVRVYSG